MGEGVDRTVVVRAVADDDHDEPDVTLEALDHLGHLVGVLGLAVDDHGDRRHGPLVDRSVTELVLEDLEGLLDAGHDHGELAVQVLHEPRPLPVEVLRVEVPEVPGLLHDAVRVVVRVRVVLGVGGTEPDDPHTSGGVLALQHARGTLSVGLGVQRGHVSDDAAQDVLREDDPRDVAAPAGGHRHAVRQVDDGEQLDLATEGVERLDVLDVLDAVQLVDGHVCSLMGFVSRDTGWSFQLRCILNYLFLGVKVLVKFPTSSPPSRHSKARCGSAEVRVAAVPAEAFCPASSDPEARLPGWGRSG